MDERRDPNRFVGGLVLLGLGVLFLLSNFGYFSWDLWGRWWPLVLIALGLIILLRRREGAMPAAPPPEPPGGAAAGGGWGGGEELPSPVQRRRDYPTGAIILIGIGLAFLLDDVIGGNAFPALVLMAIGLALLLRDWNRRSR
jgi:hypothetical protein